MKPRLMLLGMLWGAVTAFGGAEEWLQPAIDAAAAKGGGKVVVPAGDHPCKSLRLRSNVELHLERGARLVGSTNSEDYVSFPDEICAIHPEHSTKVFIYGWDLENVAITGEGVIDGQGPEFFDRNSVLWVYFWKKPQCERPRMVQLVNCRGIRFEGVTFKDSPCWTMLIKKCENIVFDRIKVLADLHIVNSDGVDFDTCRHVRVRNCEFSTGDDCFAIRAIRDPDSGRRAICEDIEITDCKLVSNCQTVRFGCPSDDEIRNVTVRNVTGRGGYCINFDYPARYLSPRDDGFMDIHDILIENYTGEARHVGLRIKTEPGVKIRSVRNVTFRNVNITCKVPSDFVSNVFSKMENIRFERVVFNGELQPDGPVRIDATNSEPLQRSDGHSWETNEKGKGIVKPLSKAAHPKLILHMDFNTIQRTKESVIQLLRQASRMGYNAVLWEVEDKVRWDLPEIAAPDAISKADFREILAEAKRLKMEPIPLFQIFGHGEYILNKAPYRHLKELPDAPDCYCVSNPEVVALQQRLLAEYLDLFGSDVKWMHLGGDEAYSFGKCATCSKHSRNELFLRHLGRIGDFLEKRGVRSGVWADMVCGHWWMKDERPDPAKVPRKYIVWHWDYISGSNDGWTPPGTDMLPKLKELGFDVVYAGASESLGDGPFLPFMRRHRRNLAEAAGKVRDLNLSALCVTSWSIRQVIRELQLPLFHYAAKRFYAPSADAEADWAQCVADSRCGLTVAELEAATDWGNNLSGFDGRQATVYKDGTIANPQMFERVLRSYKLPKPEEFRKLRSALANALAKTDGKWREACELQLMTLNAIEAAIARRPYPLERSRAAKFLENEQTPASAAHSAAMIWGYFPE